MQDVSLAALGLRLVISLVIVIGLMSFATKMLRKRAGFASTGGRGRGKSKLENLPIEVVGRQALGRNASVAIVRAANKTLVLGVTDGTVSVLTELEPLDLLAIEDGSEAEWTELSGDAERSNQSWTGLLEQLRERTVRRS